MTAQIFLHSFTLQKFLKSQPSIKASRSAKLCPSPFRTPITLFLLRYLSIESRFFAMAPIAMPATRINRKTPTAAPVVDDAGAEARTHRIPPFMQIEVLI